VSITPIEVKPEEFSRRRGFQDPPKDNEAPQIDAEELRKSKFLL